MREAQASGDEARVGELQGQIQKLRAADLDLADGRVMLDAQTVGGIPSDAV
jgi:hypothetical protein